MTESSEQSSLSSAQSGRPAHTDRPELPANRASDHPSDRAAGRRSEPAQRRLLVIAYYFPPLGLSGVVRVSKFCRYLPSHGWHPTVLTVGDIGYYAHDESLLAEIERTGIDIERTKTRDPLRLFRRRKSIALPTAGRRRMMSAVTQAFMQPDNKIGWKRHAVKRGLELAEQEGFDAILATAPPFTDFMIGYELQQALNIPLVIDYRDPWLDNQDYFYATPMHRSYAKGWEEKILKQADGIVVVNRRIKEGLLSQYRFLDHETVRIIPSGYDRSDFAQAASEPVAKSRRMRLTFSGVCDAHHTPEMMFEALAKLFAKNKEIRDEIELCFVGSFHERFRKKAAKMGVASALVTTGYVEHIESIRYLLSSDVLWLSARHPAVTPGKIHEYIGSRKPIVAIAPDGALSRLLREYDAATIVEPGKVDQLAEAIERMHTLWSRGELPVGDREFAERFEQQGITGELARALSYAVRI